MAFSKHSLKGYNSYSKWQLSTSLHSLPVVEENLKSLLDLTEGPLTIVDYGCSEGLNSMLYFFELFSSFRKYSDREITMIHTDLDQNDWQVLYKLINSAENSYLTLPKIYYSTIGRSFFDQILPSNSVDLGFSAFSFHYLSTKPKRKENDFTIPHENMKIQAIADINTLLTHRIAELKPNRTLTVLVAASSEPRNMNLGKLYYLPFLGLIERGIISKEELHTLEWNVYGLSAEEWNQVLSAYSEKIEVLKLEINKNMNPFYQEYKLDNDLQKYKENLARSIAEICRLQLYSIIENRSDSEKEHAFQCFFEEEIKAINPDEEYYWDITTLVVRKK